MTSYVNARLNLSSGLPDCRVNLRNTFSIPYLFMLVKHNRLQLQQCCCFAFLRYLKSTRATGADGCDIGLLNVIDKTYTRRKVRLVKVSGSVRESRLLVLWLILTNDSGIFRRSYILVFLNWCGTSFNERHWLKDRRRYMNDSCYRNSGSRSLLRLKIFTIVTILSLSYNTQ